MDALITAVAEAFRLARPEDVVAEPMVGSASRLWRFDTPAGAFVVKELSHDTSEHLARRRRAASFEWSVFESGVVAIPEPVLAESNEIVVPLPGSRGPLASQSSALGRARSVDRSG